MGRDRLLLLAGVALFSLALGAGLYQALLATSRPPSLSIVPKRLVLDMIAAGDRERAVSELEAMLRLDPGRMDLEGLLARTLSELGRHEQAVAHVRRAVALRPDLPGARMLLLRELSALGRFEEVVAEYRELSRLLPADPIVRNNLGSALERAGEAEAALGEYQVAVAMEPRLVQAHFNLGRSHLARGEPGPAAAALEQVVGLRPGVVEGHVLLGRAYLALGRTADAEARFRHALESEPWRMPLRRDLALLLAETGRRAEGIEALHELVADGSEDPEVQNALAWLLATHPDAAQRAPQRAVRMAEQAVAQGAEAHRLDTLAVAYAAAGRFDDAVAAARRALAAARQGGDAALAGEIAARLQAFQAARPWQGGAEGHGT